MNTNPANTILYRPVGLEDPDFNLSAPRSHRQFRKEAAVSDLLEAIAELEHRQWQHRTQATAPEGAEPLRARWKESWRPYAELPEEAKELDRIWARHVLEFLREQRLISST